MMHQRHADAARCAVGDALHGAVLDDEVHALAAATAKGVEISRILLEYDQGELW